MFDFLSLPMLKINPDARQRVEQMAKHARKFPNVGAAGYYDPFSQVICLGSLERKHLQLIASTDDFGTKKAFLPLLTHEVRHYFDHISTVWGRRQIVALYNAMNARVSEKETEYYRIPEAIRGLTLDAFPGYYSTISDDPAVLADRRNWKYRPTSGQRFSYDGRPQPNRPILFTRFATQDDKAACRCPFSIESLLETGAIRDEAAAAAALISSLPEDAQMMETAQLQKETISRLYNPELGKYSVAVHAVANALHLQDFVLASEISSRLACVCLNLPDGEFDRLLLPDRLKEAGFDDWRRVHPLYVAERDRGYLFVAIINHGAALSPDDPAKWLDEATAAAGLGGTQSINNAATAEMSRQLDLLDGPFRERLNQLLKIGFKLFKQRGVAGDRRSVAEGMANPYLMPPVILGDDHVLAIGQFKEQGAVDRLQRRISTFWDIQQSMHEFVDACGL